MIDLVRDRMDSPLPLAELLRNDPRQAFEDSLESAEVIGSERLRGIDCNHLALRNPDADLQFWIAQGSEPHALLLAFCATTYAIAPVASFGWLLLAMGTSQCEADARRTRLAYLGVFALLILYAHAPWLGGG